MNKDDEAASAEIMAAFSAMAPGMSGPFDGCLDVGDPVSFDASGCSPDGAEHE